MKYMIVEFSDGIYDPLHLQMEYTIIYIFR